VPRAWIISLLSLSTALSTAAPRPFDAEALVSMNRLSDLRLSPDGTQLMYSLRETDRSANKGVNAIWQMPVAGGAAVRLTEKELAANSGRFSADGKAIYFLSNKSGSSQLWRRDLAKATNIALSQLPLDIGSFVLAPDGKHVAFSVDVFADCQADFACSKKRGDDKAAAKATGTLHDKLFIRHWDTWADGTRTQLFIASIADDGLRDIKLLSQGIDGDIPSKPHGDDSEYSFSPDSKTVYFNARIAGKTEPWSTNFDIYRVPADASAAPSNLSASNLAWDTTPVVSADGKTLYYRAMSRPGFEADRFALMAKELATGNTREIAPKWDRSPDGISLSRDGKTIYATSANVGQHTLFAIDIKTGSAKEISGPGNVSGFAVAAKQVFFVRDDLSHPADVYAVASAGGKLAQLTNVNAAMLAELQFGAAEQFSFAGANDELVYGWVVMPVGALPGKKYPIAFLIHGGPQGSFGNQFHYRWNPQTYAGQGFAAVMIDFHGSTGYGQKFTDAISGDWGGKPLIDLQKGLAAARAKFPALDAKRACALGGSYGGYMTNWIAGAWPDGFQCLVTHAGIFDKRFMAYSTEELWFDEWENGGVAWEKASAIESDNPITKVQNWVTPTLVIHGMKDFRVPFEQGISAFTALQRKGIESQFLWYPDENHWILKPENSLQWHNTVNAWLHKHLD
jgi:dipeptidyl aminopeptidase/acylaminoacyl peptidase